MEKIASLSDLNKENDYVIVGVIGNFNTYLLLDINTIKMVRGQFIDDNTDTILTNPMLNKYIIDSKSIVKGLLSGYKIHGAVLDNNDIKKTEELISIANNSEDCLIVIKSDSLNFLVSNTKGDVRVINKNNPAHAKLFISCDNIFCYFNRDLSFTDYELAMLYIEKQKEWQLSFKMAIDEKIEARKEMEKIERQSKGIFGRLFGRK